MTDPTGESKSAALRLNFDRRLLLQFRGSVITSDGGYSYRELDDVLGLTTSGGGRLAETRTGEVQTDAADQIHRSPEPSVWTSSPQLQAIGT